MTTAAVAVRVGPAWHERLREAAVTYLPLLLMAWLAIGTWWLVKNAPKTAADAPAGVVRHEPDYTMQHFVVQRYTREGRLRVQIEGDELRHYPDTDTLEIDNVHVHATAPDGTETNATALRGISNADGSEVQLIGRAQVVRTPAARVAGSTAAAVGTQPIEFRSEFLHAYFNTEQVRSHLPVTVRRGGADLRADAFDYDNLGRILQLRGGVHASFPPPPR